MENEKERIACLEQWKETTSQTLSGVVEDIKEIKDNLLKRPSWATLCIITMLSSGCIGLLVAFLNKQHIYKGVEMEKETNCKKCGVFLKHTNNKPDSYTTHHIFPQKYFKGSGPVETLCRRCHDRADKLIERVDLGKKLPEDMYRRIHKRFMDFF